jgi:putative oxygen-independent coproporphyrinogen III oxidase
VIDRAPHNLYLHVPFCVSKCPYCDFNSHVGLEGIFESYNRALVTEIETWGRELGGPRLDTVFIGGGTPSRVPAGHIAAALEAVRRSFDFAPGAEVSLEANPQSAEAVKMDAWLAAGVNRLSLGFQSLDAEALGFLERAHDADEAIGVFGRARRAGFNNVSCDLIFGIPGLSTTRWEEVLAEVLALRPDHLSTYELTPEAGTRLGTDVGAGRTAMPDEELVLAQYEVAARLMPAHRFRRYEVSNWARPGRECRHNVAYWSGVPYAAAGAGAHAFVFDGDAPSWLTATRPPTGLAARQWNRANPAAYIAAVRRTGAAPAGHEWLEAGAAVGDLMMMGLRRDLGVDLAAASDLYGLDVAAKVRPVVDRLCGIGMLERDGARVRATERGMMVLNQVVSEFIGKDAGSAQTIAAVAALG